MSGTEVEARMRSILGEQARERRQGRKPLDDAFHHTPGSRGVQRPLT